jgi:MFS family permease
MPLLGEEKGFNPGDLGMFFFFTHVPQFFAVLAAGLLADRFGRKMPIVPAAVFMTLGIAVFVVTDSYWLLLVSGVLLGSGEGLAGPPTVTYFADRAPRGMEGVVMGLYGTFSGAGALGGALILGSLADAYSFEVALWVDAFVFLGLGLAVMALVRESARRISRSGPG